MTEQTATFASNQTEAAAALQISEAEWDALRQQPGFPARTPQGWDLAAINAWLESDTAPTDQPPEDPPAGEQTSDVDQADGAAQAPALDASDDDPDGELPDDAAGDEPVEIRQITITLPLAEPREGTYIAGAKGRINTRLRKDQLAGYRQLHAGLREANATFANGRPVDSAGDVLQWVFQQITTAIDAADAD